MVSSVGRSMADRRTRTPHRSVDRSGIHAHADDHSRARGSPPPPLPVASAASLAATSAVAAEPPPAPTAAATPEVSVAVAAPPPPPKAAAAPSKPAAAVAAAEGLPPLPSTWPRHHPRASPAVSYTSTVPVMRELPTPALARPDRTTPRPPTTSPHASTPSRAPQHADGIASRDMPSHAWTLINI